MNIEQLWIDLNDLRDLTELCPSCDAKEGDKHTQDCPLGRALEQVFVERQKQSLDALINDRAQFLADYYGRGERGDRHWDQCFRKFKDEMKDIAEKAIARITPKLQARYSREGK